MNTQEFKQPGIAQVQEAFRKAANSPEIQTMLRTLYGNAVEQEEPDNRPITERIKTFEDAVNALGDTHPLVIQYSDIFGSFLEGAAAYNSCDIVAYLKLRIICAALNEGWEPKFTEDEWRYYPYFWLYTQKEIDGMEAEEKQECRLMSAGGFQTESAGFAFASSSYVPSHSDALVGSRLCLKSDTLAIYCGKQFIDLWADFYLIRKSDND